MQFSYSVILSVQQKHLAIIRSLLSCDILVSDGSRKRGQWHLLDTITKINFFCQFSNKSTLWIVDQINLSGMSEELQYPYFRCTEVWYFNRSEKKMRELIYPGSIGSDFQSLWMFISSWYTLSMILTIFSSLQLWR